MIYKCQTQKLVTSDVKTSFTSDTYKLEVNLLKKNGELLLPFTCFTLPNGNP